MLRAALLWSIALVSAPTALFRPYYGLLIYLFVTHMQFIAFMHGGFVVKYGPLMGGSLLLGYLMNNAFKSPPPIHRMKMLMAFWAWFALSTVLSFDVSTSVTTLKTYSQMFLIALVVGGLANSADKIHNCLRAMLGGLGVLASKTALVVIVTAGGARIEGPGYSSVLTDENDYAMAMCVAAVGLWLLGRIETGWKRTLAKGMAVAAAISVVGTYSRGGLLGLIAAALFITVTSKKKMLGFAGLALVAVLFIAFAPQNAMDRYRTIENAAETDGSAQGRIRSWQTGWKMATQNPLFGIGPGNYNHFYQEFDPLLDRARAAHNIYVGRLAENGFPGLLFFLGAILGPIMMLWINERHLRRTEGGARLADIALVIRGCLLVFMVPNTFTDGEDWDFLYHLIGLAAAFSLVAGSYLENMRRPAHDFTEVPVEIDIPGAPVKV